MTRFHRFAPEKKVNLIEGKWYYAYAYHKWAGPEDIDFDESFDTYEEAWEYACQFLCDDDTIDVFQYKEGCWWVRRFLYEDEEPIDVKYSEL